jgi:beta-ureidopropionase
MGAASIGAAVAWPASLAADDGKKAVVPARILRLALIQFNAVPEQIDANLRQMARLTKKAAAQGARWIVFHEGTVCDYTPRLDELAETVPDGRSTRFMLRLAKEKHVTISFGLSEQHQGHFYITQVFVGPAGFIYRYRKTWLWRSADDRSYRNEWARYDPGTGPELFEVDGIKATCFICADGNSARCLERMQRLHPQVAFYPNNRTSLHDPAEYAERARKIGAPLLVPNRVGQSWGNACDGGSIAYGPNGAILARANHDGREEILMCDVPIAN